MMGPDKPVIPGQWLFHACYLSSAENNTQLVPTPPGLYSSTDSERLWFQN